MHAQTREAYIHLGISFSILLIIARLIFGYVARKDAYVQVNGVIPPECLDPEPFLAKSTEKGTRIYEKVERCLA